MPPRVLLSCPGCGNRFRTSGKWAPGQMVGCPACRLLFAPTPEEVRPLPRRQTRRRSSSAKLSVPALVAFFSLGLLLLTLGIAAGTWWYLRAPAPAPLPNPEAAAASHPVPEPDPPSPPRRTEVEDPPAQPARPVPALDPPAATPGTPETASPRPRAERLRGAWEPSPGSSWPADRPRPTRVEFLPDGRLRVQARLGLEVTEIVGTWRVLKENAETWTLKIALAAEEGGPASPVELIARLVAPDRVRFEGSRPALLPEQLQRLAPSESP